MPIVQTPQGIVPTIPLASGRSSGLATPSFPFYPGPGRSGVGLIAGRTISFAKIYRSQPWVGASIRRLAEQSARIPIHGFEYLDPEQDARRRVRGHAAVRLLNTPRPRMSGVQLRWQIALGLKVHGNHVLYKRRPNRGAPPSELWTLDYRLLVPHMDGDTGVVVMWEWQGNGVPGLRRGDLIDPADVVHFAWAAPEGELGVSPLEQLGVTIRSEDAIQRYGEAYFRNGVRVGVAAILDAKADASKVSRDGVREELVGANGGVDQAFSAIVLGGGVTDVKTLGGQSAVEAELVEQRKVNREETAGVLGVPQPLAGILDHATYSNIGELLGALFTIYLAPDFALTAGTLQAQLVNGEPAWARDGVFLEHNLDEVLKGDTAKRFAAYAIGVATGFLTLNDVRRRENLPPYEDPRADEPLIAANNVRPLSDVGVEEGAQEAATALRALLAGGSDDTYVEAQLERALHALGGNGQSAELAHAVVAGVLNAEREDAK